MSQTTPDPFSWTTRIRLGHSDAAGRIYFIRALDLAHQAYEALLDALGFPLGPLLAGDFGLPIAEANVKLQAELKVGDEVEFSIRRERVGRTSYILQTELFCGGRAVGRCRTVHVCVGADGRPQPLPEALGTALRERLPEVEA